MILFKYLVVDNIKSNVQNWLTYEWVALFEYLAQCNGRHIDHGPCNITAQCSFQHVVRGDLVVGGGGVRWWIYVTNSLTGQSVKDNLLLHFWVLFAAQARFRESAKRWPLHTMVLAANTMVLAAQTRRWPPHKMVTNIIKALILAHSVYDLKRLRRNMYLRLMSSISVWLRCLSAAR